MLGWIKYVGEKIDDMGMTPYYGNWDAIFALLGFGEITWSPLYTVRASMEGRGRPGQTALNSTTSYGFDPQTDFFVALPDSTLNGQCVNLFTDNGAAIGVPVGDVGPINGGGTYSDPNAFNDPYWSPGPGGFQDPESSTGTDLRGRSYGPAETGVGIDISYALQQQLGLRGNTTVSWNFTSCSDPLP